MRKNNKGFTLIELMVSMVIISVAVSVVFSFIFMQQKRAYLLKINSETLKNMTMVNANIGTILKNSYGICWSETSPSQLCLYIDKLEKAKKYIYVKKDLPNDLSRIYISDGVNEEPMHGSNLFVSSITFTTTSAANKDIQPMVSIDISARTRSPLKVPTQDKYYDLYNRSYGYLHNSWTIRNYVPSSGK